MKGYTKDRFTGKYLLTPGLKLIGGKNKSKDLLYQKMPKHEIYIEPFLGSGAVLIGKPKANAEMAYDLNPHVINFYKVLQDNPEKFWGCLQLSMFDFSEDKFQFHKRMLGHITTPPHCQAVDFYIVTKFSMNGIVRFNKKGECNSSFCGTVKGRGIYTREWFDAVRERIKDVNFYVQDYKETLKVASNFGTEAFCFLDSPYESVRTVYLADYWKQDRFIEYAEAVDTLKCNWLMTINDTPFIRDLFKGYNIIPHELFYSCSQTNEGRGMKKELLIANYDL